MIRCTQWVIEADGERGWWRCSHEAVHFYFSRPASESTVGLLIRIALCQGHYDALKRTFEVSNFEEVSFEEYLVNEVMGS